MCCTCLDLQFRHTSSHIRVCLLVLYMHMHMSGELRPIERGYQPHLPPAARGHRHRHRRDHAGVLRTFVPTAHGLPFATSLAAHSRLCWTPPLMSLMSHVSAWHTQDPSKENFCPYLTGSKRFTAAPPASVCQVHLPTPNVVTCAPPCLLPTPAALPVLPTFLRLLFLLLTYSLTHLRTCQLPNLLTDSTRCSTSSTRSRSARPTSACSAPRATSTSS